MFDAPPFRPFLIALLVAAPACNRTYGVPLAYEPDDAAVPTGDLVLGARTASASFPVGTRDKLDVLFLIDNSFGMEAMQGELRAEIGQILKPLSDLADAGLLYADLHIGVVTSDFGAGARGAPGCTPSSLDGGGDRGRLQQVGKAAPPGCLPPKGAAFIDYALGPTGPSRSNLPGVQGLVETFLCMSAVGTGGCGFEHQLESVFAALRNNYPENAGFLRDDAGLAVVFLTNEDDGSAPPDVDLFDRAATRTYGYLSSYARETRWGVLCGGKQPPYRASGGPLTGCVPAPNPSGAGPGKLYDVSRYIDFFTQPRAFGGVKADPRDVALIAIDAPEAPFEVILSNPATAIGEAYAACSPLNDDGNPACSPVLQRSCRHSSGYLFGDPAVRLNAVVKAAANHAVASICEGNYGAAFQPLYQLLSSDAGPRCFPNRLAAAAGGAPLINCVVTESVTSAGVTTTTSLPRCNASKGETCWDLVPKTACSGPSPDGLGLDIAWQGAPPRRATVEITCQVE